MIIHRKLTNSTTKMIILWFSRRALQSLLLRDNRYKLTTSLENILV